MLIVGNWKMNGDRASNVQLLRALLEAGETPCSLAICAPHVYLADCAAQLHGSAISLGAQDVSQHERGAYTGEVSAAMLADIGCRYVIVGHSERRVGHHESDALVAAKLRRAWEAGLTPILCTGETRDEYYEGRTQVVLRAQLRGALAGISATADAVALIVAYEPVWAIGTGLAATPSLVQEVHQFLRRELAQLLPRRVPLLYGGSMKPDTAAALLALPDVDGGLVGGASLNAREFLAIANAAKQSPA
jgi:triosephosphate isomerase